MPEKQVLSNTARIFQVSHCRNMQHKCQVFNMFLSHSFTQAFMSWLQSPLNTHRWMVQHCQPSREQRQTAKFRDEISDLLIAGWLLFMSCCCPRSRATEHGSCKSFKETKIVMISDFSPNYQLFCASWGYIMSWQWKVKILLFQMHFTCECNPAWAAICMSWVF